MAEDASREEIVRAWNKGWTVLFEALQSLRPEDLTRTVTIRHEPHSVLQAINRFVAHSAYHVGQIVFLAKHWKGAEWNNLSVPKGKSAEINARMAQQYSAGKK